MGAEVITEAVAAGEGFVGAAGEVVVLMGEGFGAAEGGLGAADPDDVPAAGAAGVAVVELAGDEGGGGHAALLAQCQYGQVSQR
jgi:hypothetical protein